MLKKASFLEPSKYSSYRLCSLPLLEFPNGHGIRRLTYNGMRLLLFSLRSVYAHLLGNVILHGNMQRRSTTDGISEPTNLNHGDL